jgi:hypothetical protein
MSENEKEQNISSDENPIQSVAQMADRLEKANAEAKEILKKQEELYARTLLGGNTNAGIQETKKPEETAKEYAQRILKGKI